MQDQWTDRLSEYVDGELTDSERDAVESHLTGCPRCAATLQELKAVVERTRSLGPRPPETDLWQSIANRIAAPPRLAPFQARAYRRFSFTLPQLAAASVLIALASGAVAWSVAERSAKASRYPEASRSAEASRDGETAQTDREPSGERTLATVSLADAQYDAAVAELQRALDKGRGHLDPATIQILEQNLTIIDRAIADAQRAVADDPGNTYLTTHLVEARRKKIDLLRRATALTTEMD
jgi:hypothetical protein